MAPFGEHLNREHAKLVHASEDEKWAEYDRIVVGVDNGFFFEHGIKRPMLRPNEVEFLIENEHTDILNAAKEKGMLPQDIDE